MADAVDHQELAGLYDSHPWVRDATLDGFEPRGDRSIWLQIYDRLRQLIAQGSIAPGERLPGENQLSEAFGVTRVTLRRALTKLQREGFLEVRKGVGAFVRVAPASYTISSNKRFIDALESDADAVATRTLEITRGVPLAAAALALEMRESDEAILLTRVRLLDGQPVYLTSKTFSAARLPDFERVYGVGQSVAEVFRDHGIAEFQRLETRVSGGFATREEALALRLTPETPVLRTTSLNSDSAGRPIEFSRGCWPLSMVELVFHEPEISGRLMAPGQD